MVARTLLLFLSFHLYLFMYFMYSLYLRTILLVYFIPFSYFHLYLAFKSVALPTFFSDCERSLCYSTSFALCQSLETQEVSTIDGLFWYSTKEFVWSNAIFIQCRQEWVQIRLRAGGNKYTQSRFRSVKITYLSRPLPFLSFLPLLIPRWVEFVLQWWIFMCTPCFL